MIRIYRDNFPPDDKYKVNPNKGQQRWRCIERTVIQEYNLDNSTFISGKFIFVKHPSYDLWKNELVKIQGRKCCFCEKPIGYGSLDHFRPKQGWQQKKGDALTRPGYYWLAYRWTNLILVCNECNECNESGQKGNLFPIDGTRAGSSIANLHLESAVLINPYNEDPTLCVSYYKDRPISKGARGLQTINILKLNDRADLNEIRKDRFDLYSIKNQIAALDNPTKPFTQDKIDDAKKFILDKIKNKEPFSGMIRENLKNGTLD